jgi:1-acyl-sn-glycerol-3-phosphate acyltransferase
MSVIKNILGRIFAIWAILVFVPTLFVVIIPIGISFLIKEPLGTEVFRRSSKIWMQVFLTLTGCRLIIKGKQYFEEGKNYVVVCNHNSLMDVPVTTPFVPGANKTIAKRSMSKIPVFGWVYTRGSVLVDRNNDESRRKSFEDMKQALSQGLHMVIYPEGTRNRTTDPLKVFFDGAFKLAVDAKKDIIPTLIFNTGKVLPVHKTFFYWPQRLEMHFLPPVETTGFSSKELKTKVFEIMWDYYLKHHNQIK